MIENEKLPEWIDRYNANDLKGKELEEFLLLLEQDPDLRKEVRLDKELNELLSETNILELREKIIKAKPKEDGRNTLISLWLLAASVVILIGLTFYSYLQWSGTKAKLDLFEKEFSLNDTSLHHYKEKISPNQIEIDRNTIDSAISREQRGDSSIRLAVRAQLADNFTPFLPFESLVGEMNRSGYFRLILPVSSESFRRGGKITFSWETDSHAPIKLEITDNMGFTQYKSEELKVKILTIQSLKFTPGLYYFKFFEKDELVCFGKFMIR